MATLSELPKVPTKHADFISYVQSKPNTPLPELLEPYKEYDAKLREVFAQEPHHPAIADKHLNIVPVFNGYEHELKIRARDLASESPEEKERYVMPLKDEDRRPSGSPAIVSDIKDFQQNFAVFNESSLVDLDWSNVVAAGSSVVTSLLPVPDKYKNSKRALRQYYHETVAPASDVDLFLYGLSEEDAVKKIIEIEKRIKDSILTETTTIRTKNAITIASQYPTRHIQIVLRIYKSVAEILTGFDVDCSCAAYDGKQVWAAPRALTAYMTQTNTIDLTRRSPSYENRLSKYSHRGFEVYWPNLDRSRIDPTIYERNFARTVGLARLLVLEKLPTKSERESYMDERRRERGRPAVNRLYNFSMRDNLKDRYEDEVAEWVDQEDVSDYHTFTIPYGPKYHAKKIEKLLYTKDLLLNAEWNKREDREVTLHRHPAFFGYAEDVIHDCCGYCPKPVTPEEHDVAEEEAKIYVSGEISFIKDDPGRQAIGSFNPITSDDWTEMAYVGNTARLCQAIIDHDLEHVEDWLSQEGSDPNCRDYTGRTPLHLAVMSSSPEIVRTLIDHGARLVARLADGRTALHLAAARGNVEMVKMIMQRSEENEEEEAKKEDIRKRARMAARESKNNEREGEVEKTSAQDEESDMEVVEKDEDSDDDARTTTTGSFIKVKPEEKKTDDIIPDEEEDEPDVYDVNVLTWDTQCSALHYAILNGHVDVVKELVQTFGADVLLPIKLLNDYDKSPRGAILTLVLSLNLSIEKAKAMTEALLELGASSAQADMQQRTALFHISCREPELLETMVQFDEPSFKRAINHLAVSGGSWSPTAESALLKAIHTRNATAALKLLEAGASPEIDFNSWMKSVEAQFSLVSSRDSERNNQDFLRGVEQPIVTAVMSELPGVALQLLEMGADPNTLPKLSHYKRLNAYRRHDVLESLLDIVRRTIRELKDYKETEPTKPHLKLDEGVDYLSEFEAGSYKHFIAQVQLNAAQKEDKQHIKNYEKSLKKHEERKGVAEKQQAINDLVKEYENFEKALLERGAKTFRELYPDASSDKDQHSYPGYVAQQPTPFKLEFGFSVYDLTVEKQEAYCKLFQAAWDGDLETIKSLTLFQPDASNSMPLKIAIQDKNEQSPFSLAVLRGHYDVARAIIEISYAQYELPEDEKPKRYRLGDEDEDDASDSSEIPITQEIVNDTFTIENIGELSTQVKSHTSPLAFVAFPCSAWDYVKFCLQDKKYTCGTDDREIKGGGILDLVAWSITTNDKALFSFLLDLDVEWTDRLAKRLDSSSGIPSFSQPQFELAMEYGRTELLTEMIKHAGAGMELQALVKKSGVKYREKPKFYQGLSVHGKKRADWVNAARGTYVQSVSDTSPPLLQAAFKGSLLSVEWFLSDTPARHYLDFSEAYKDDKFIAHLNKNAGGFENVLRKWLGARSELALHCAVMAEPRPETVKLIRYLIKAMPESLETKSKNGFTPLSLAFSLHRFEAAKILIDAGADQTVRDTDGNNILHLLLCPAFTNAAAHRPEQLRAFLELIDKRLIPSLLLERCSSEPGSLTPVANWLRMAYENDKCLNVILEFTKFTGHEFLELFDGTGDTPLHHIVKVQRQVWLKSIVEHRPDLLHRENSVGRTPYELAQDAYTSNCVKDNPRVVQAQSPIKSRESETFAPDYERPPESASRESIWRVCEELINKNPAKRKLVSLLEANEVTKRLATRHSRKQYSRAVHDAASDAGSDDGYAEDAMDEVNLWYRSAPDPGVEGTYRMFGISRTW